MDWYGDCDVSNRYNSICVTQTNVQNPFKSLIQFFRRRPMLFSSLLLISIGNGSIRACITSLGGHQFKLPEQTDALNTYFSHYYFVYYMGILLSKIVPPAIRADTQCFGKDECYAAVFGFLGSVFLCCWSKIFLS